MTCETRCLAAREYSSVSLSRQDQSYSRIHRDQVYYVSMDVEYGDFVKAVSN
jgi:hypothetical protein